MQLKRLFNLVIFMSTFFSAFAQIDNAVVSGIVRHAQTKELLPYVNVVVTDTDDAFLTGTITNEKGVFTIEGLSTGDYSVKVSFIGFEEQVLLLHVGRLNNFLDLGTISLAESSTELEEVTVTATRMEVASAMDKKTFAIEDNISQQGGSVLQVMQNLPGVTIDRDGKIFLRGSDKVTILIDGKQTAITGMGSQSGLDNIPASAIGSVEIIHNPSAKYDASGMAGIINIVFKKQQEFGWNGKAGLALGLGALAEKEPSLNGIRKQYRYTPKVNPSFSANYKRAKTNVFVQADFLYHKQMMKNEFTQRIYDNGEKVTQQFLENRTQPIYNIKAGIDYNPNKRNTFTFSTLYNYREYTDLGDIPYDNAIGDRVRLWQYYENEVNQTLFATITHKHSFNQPGHSLTSSFNYSFRRKDEVFNFTNKLYNPNTIGTDTTGLLADENIFDLTVDYSKPLKTGRLELGTKQRGRFFPNDIYFKPGNNSILDPTLAGSAEYREWLSALYGTYIYEHKKFELEAGLRLEYANVDYLVDPNHSVYSSTGFDYIDPFPSVRATWLINDNSRVSAFYNRRVDRPEEKELRTFPTYASPEILSMGNPNLQPQFTQSVELGFRQSWNGGYLYSAAYHRMSTNLLTKIITEVSPDEPSLNLLAEVNQNADKGQNTGVELVLNQQLGRKLRLNANGNIYRNKIGAFSIVNAYPSNVPYTGQEQTIVSGNAKINLIANFLKDTEVQITGTYLAPDIIPQGKILARYSIDAGLTKKIQNGKGELFINASDIFNTLVMRYEIDGANFKLNSDDYYETQVIRVGYQYRF
ncbi:MAG: TonB-dependent receptor [Dysgonamonadaceae bacterium]|nr:TonB-dependent receptor [Dysgonamonadaceae bacterium]MDD4727319.1 TonB-dependent receptor [Dysgonamonadaceae bacterium]